MGLLNKIKSALFEEDEEDEKETVEKQQEIAKKIELPIKEKEEITIKHYDQEDSSSVSLTNYSREDRRKTPIIFDVEDFIEEEIKPPVKKVEKKEEKILYGGYDIHEKELLKGKDEFKPSPIISPVYGILDKNYTVEHAKTDRKSLDQLFVEEKKQKIDFDTIRQKAYGIKMEEENNTEEDKSLLYEMENINDKPGIEKISLGDAEEYFEDLGLEYDVDYTDLAKAKMTRSKKNKDLTEEIEEKPAPKIEKKKIKSETEEEPNEKNLYDLIDMMYSDKE